MTLQELVTELNRLDVKITLAGSDGGNGGNGVDGVDGVDGGNGGKLHVVAPAGVLTGDLKKELRRHKPALVKLLQEETDLDCQAKEIARVFRERGWVAFESRLLNGEVVVFVRDEKIAIPTRWKNAVKYTLAELEALTAPPVPDRDELKAIHETKRVFDGRVTTEEEAMTPET